MKKSIHSRAERTRDQASSPSHLAYLSHVLLGSEDQFKVYYPLGELLEQTAVRMDVHRLERRVIHY